MNALSSPVSLASPPTPSVEDVIRHTEGGDTRQAFFLALQLPSDGTRNFYAQRAVMSRITRIVRQGGSNMTIPEMFAYKCIRSDLEQFMSQRLREIVATEGKRYICPSSSYAPLDPE